MQHKSCPSVYYNTKIFRDDTESEKSLELRVGTDVGIISPYLWLLPDALTLISTYVPFDLSPNGTHRLSNC